MRCSFLFPPMYVMVDQSLSFSLNCTPPFLNQYLPSGVRSMTTTGVRLGGFLLYLPSNSILSSTSNKCFVGVVIFSPHSLGSAEVSTSSWPRQISRTLRVPTAVPKAARNTCQYTCH